MLGWNGNSVDNSEPIKKKKFKDMLFCICSRLRYRVAQAASDKIIFPQRILITLQVDFLEKGISIIGPVTTKKFEIL